MLKEPENSPVYAYFGLISLGQWERSSVHGVEFGDLQLLRDPLEEGSNEEWHLMTWQMSEVQMSSVHRDIKKGK